MTDFVLTLQRDLEEDMSWMEWTSVLKLSQMWKMKLINDLGLQKIPGRIHNLDQWIAALKISTQFRIQGLREIAIEELTNKLNSLNKVELAIECGVEPWLTMGCTELVTRQECISGEEEDRLGPSRTSNLFRVRHRRLQSLSTRMSRYDVYDVQADIQKSFESEFANIAAFDSSPVSYWQPNLRTATDPDDIRRDEEYYCIDVIFRVNFFKRLPMQFATHLIPGGRHFIQTSSLSVRGEFGCIPRHVSTSCS
jgi:hypothetical protein